MKNYFGMPSMLNKLADSTWAILWLMLPISLKGTVICLWIFGFIIIIRSFVKKPVLSRDQFKIAGIFVVFFIWHVVSFAFDENQLSAGKNLERKLPLIVIPLIMIFANQVLKNKEKWAARGLFLGLIITGIHMLINSLVRTINGADLNAWLYHDFTQPYSLGAIYYSWYLSIALIHLVFRKQEPLVEKFRFVLLSYFAVLLFLASSKLFIIATIPVLTWKLATGKFITRHKKLIISIIILFIIIGSLPFLYRMKALRTTDLDIVCQSEYNYNTPFNGLTIRLVQWRFGLEIINEHNAWFTGVGIGSKQLILNNYYERYGVYTGNPELGDSGYLDYNFHNQFVETMVGTGFIGLFILLSLIAFALFRYHSKLIFPLPVYIVMLLFFMTESVLERQAGIIPLCLLFMSFNQAPKTPQINRKGNLQGK